MQDGVDGVDGLDGAQSVTLSADGKHAYVAGFFDDAVIGLKETRAPEP